MTRRSVLITGATDGLGKAVADSLGGWDVELLLHGRDPQRISPMLAALGLTDEAGFCADFRSLAQTARLARQVAVRREKLDVLILNAGIGGEGAPVLTEDGIEQVLQVNYLVNFVLIDLLTPLLARSRGARILLVSSIGQEALDFDDLPSVGAWTAWTAYCRSKLAQIMLAFEMAPRLAEQGISINALHPASYMPTKLVSGKPESSLAEGVANVIRLALSPDIAEVSGRFFNRDREARAHGQAYQGAARARLMDWSRQRMNHAGL